MSNVVTAFVAYSRKKNDLKKRYREEMKRELEPYLAEFGRAVAEDQAKGKSVDDIEDLIGVRNRNLIYAAKRAAKGISTPSDTGTLATPSTAQEDTAEDRLEVVKVPNDGYEVYIDMKHVGTVWVDDEGGLEIPEEWALDTERASLYREAIAKVNKALKE